MVYKRVVVFMLSLFSTIFILSSCVNTEKSYKAAFNKVLSEANARHVSVIKPSDEQFATLVNGRVPDITKIQLFNSNAPLLEKVTSADAIADTEDFFELLKGIYGGYTYFGGDESFIPVKQVIIKELEALDSLSANEFTKILVNNLSTIVEDNHFRINNISLRVKTDYYYKVGEAFFLKDEKGFINYETGKRVKSFDKYDLDESFKLYINSSGDFIWNPVITVQNSNGVESMAAEITYEDGSKEKYIFYKYNSAYKPGSASLSSTSGYPVITLTEMAFDGTEAGESARKFLSYAEELRNEPVVIVDIRNNSGGNGILPIKWLHMLTGEIIPQNSIGLMAMPYSENYRNNSKYYVSPDDTLLYFKTSAYAEGYTLLDYEPDSFIKRDQLLVILTNRGTASSAERFVDLCFNLENTLIIGSSTSGALNFDQTFPSLKFPRSGLPLALGTKMYLHPEGHLLEGAGIQPDIWTTGDTLEAVAAMLNKAGY